MPLPSFLQPVGPDLDQAIRLLKAGELVALPSETVYGLAADALNPVAVRKIFTVKGRPLLDPLIVHTASIEAAESLLSSIPAGLHALAEAFWPGPLTLILPRGPQISDLVTAGNLTVALRIPAHPVFLSLLRQSKLHLAAPSANPFGYISPTRAEHVRESFAAKVPWIIDGGPCQHGLESTILDLTTDTPTLLRPGPLQPEQIEAVLRRTIISRPVSHRGTAAAPAPGTLDRHYSPSTPAVLESRATLLSTPCPEGHATLFFSKPATLQPTDRSSFWLAEQPDLAEAARNLFAMLRKLDASGFSLIRIEQFPDEGLGRSINDRLRRAATR